MLEDQALGLWQCSSFGIKWWNSNFLCLGPWFMKIVIMVFTYEQNPNSWLWYSWNLWLYLWVCVGSPNPNQGYLVLVCHFRLTFYHRIDWNPSSLWRDTWPSCHALSTMKPALCMGLIHLTYILCCLGINLDQCFIYIHSYGCFKILGFD